jgi:hypothetical protein
MKAVKLFGLTFALSIGKIDCIALSRESLTGLLPEIPGAYIIDGGFLNSTTAIAVPNGKQFCAFLARARFYATMSETCHKRPYIKGPGRP